MLTSHMTRTAVRVTTYIRCYPTQSMYVPSGFPTVFRSGGDQGDGGDPGATAPPLDISYSPVRHIESTPFPQSFTLFPFLLPFQKKGIIHVLARCAVLPFYPRKQNDLLRFLAGAFVRVSCYKLAEFGF